MDADRRDFLKTAGLGALAFSLGCASGGDLRAEEGGDGEPAPRTYALPPLPYPEDALEPDLEASVLRVHHDRHHAGYVKGLNGVLEALENARKESDFARIKNLSRDLAFHGSGHLLHALYWRSMTPDPAASPPASVAKVLGNHFGSVKGFLAQFTAAARKVEGSGWAVLAWEPLGRRLLVLQAEKHQNLAFWGAVPILVCDVWEHAYYDQYQNRRGDYVDAFVRRLDWNRVERGLDGVRKRGA